VCWGVSGLLRPGRPGLGSDEAIQQADAADEARGLNLEEVAKDGPSSFSRASQLIRGVRQT
jgi:hypothetical protein